MGEDADRLARDITGTAEWANGLIRVGAAVLLLAWVGGCLIAVVGALL
jgi:hypothetical protein